VSGDDDLAVEECRPVPSCGEAVHYLESYHHFLRGIHDVPKAIRKHLLDLEI
jgi:hypothetical protein